MKTNLLKFIVLFLSVIALTSCGGNKGDKNSGVAGEDTLAVEQPTVETPKPQKHATVQLEEEIMGLVVDKKYNEAVDLMLKHGDMTNLDVSQVKQAAPFFVQIVKGSYGKNGGLSEFEIIEPEVGEDTKKITLVKNETFADGTTKTQKIRYTLIKEEWKREVAVDNKKI